MLITRSIKHTHKPMLIFLAKGKVSRKRGGLGTDGSSKIHRNKNPFMAALSMLVFQDGPELADSWCNSVLFCSSQRETGVCWHQVIAVRESGT